MNEHLNECMVCKQPLNKPFSQNYQRIKYPVWIYQSFRILTLFYVDFQPRHEICVNVEIPGNFHNKVLTFGLFLLKKTNEQIVFNKREMYLFATPSTIPQQNTTS